jgi:hypothetical protein
MAMRELFAAATTKKQLAVIREIDPNILAYTLVDFLAHYLSSYTKTDDTRRELGLAICKRLGWKVEVETT